MKRFIFVTWMVMGAMLCARSMRAQGAAAFPYPEIPVSISEPQMRLSYLLNHFWDNFLFADTSQTNRKLAEQGIADYLNLLPHVADSASQCSAVDVFVRQAFVNASRSDSFENLLEHYLGNPASPLRNDTLYALLLRRITMILPEGDARLERYRHHLRLLSMNAPGKTATDFMYVTRGGARGRLSDISSPYTLLVFSDPDCARCRENMPQLMASKALRDGRVRVLVVYPDADTSLWRQAKPDLPSNWTDAYSPEGEVMHRPLYHLPRLPALYLLDAEKHVLVKDGSLEEVVERIGKD